MKIGIVGAWNSAWIAGLGVSLVYEIERWGPTICVDLVIVRVEITIRTVGG